MFAVFGFLTDFLSDFLSSQSCTFLRRIWAKTFPDILNHSCWLVGKYNFLEEFLRGMMLSLKILCWQNHSDVFDDEWESQTLTGTLESLWRTITARLNPSKRLLFLALKKVHVLTDYWTLAYQIACLRRLFSRLRHLFPHMGDCYN